jgi:hypothetical protein
MSFFEPTGDDTFAATGHTQGPWVPGQQHAGPPSALLARAIERVPSTVAGPSQVVRLTVEILGAVPVAEVHTRAQVVRPGRSVELIEAELLVGERPVLKARAWRVRTTPLDLTLPPPESAPPLPTDETTFGQAMWQAGYLKAMEWRFAEGHFEEPGPAVVWARQRVPLVSGEEPSGLQRLLALADSGNGVSGLIDADEWLYINTELTVHLHRQPAGEWMCLRARTTLDPNGVGLAETELFDGDGRVGRGAQALLVGRRG